MWIVLGILAWCLVSFPLGLIAARFISFGARSDLKRDDSPES